MSNRNRLATLADIKKLKSILVKGDKGWESPKPDDLRKLREYKKWSRIDVADILGLAKSYDFNRVLKCSTLEKWETPIEKVSNRRIPYSSWRLLLIHAGVVTV